MLISLIICTYNRSEILEKSVPSIFKLIIPENINLELIVVDNNSKDKTYSVATEFINIVNNLGGQITAKYVFEGNQGLSFARNKGYSESKGDYIAYIDDECVLPEQWLSEANKIIQQYNPAFLGGPYLGKYLPGSSSRWFKESFGDSYILQYNLPNGPLNNRYLSGGNMYVRRDVFEKIGVFDVNLGMSGENLNYGEEIEFQKRFKKTFPNEVIWYDEKVFLWHFIRTEKMKIPFLLGDAFIRGKSAAELRSFERSKLSLAPLHLMYFVLKAVFSALRKGVISLITQEHYFYLLYNDYKNGTWRDIGGAWYKTKRLLGII